MTLGGVLFIRNGIQYDYCFQEAIICLQALCDKVVILDAGSDDGTAEIVKSHEDQNTMVVCLDKSEWDKQHGREKLAYFQNLALSFLDTDYYFLLQADEIVHEDYFPVIRRAIETNKEAFSVHRINLWRDCNSYLSVGINRQPCNTSPIRLAKTKYKSIGDGESIDANAEYSFDYYIKMYHYGFVRKKEVMKDKVINMQEAVFGIDHDPKLDQSDVFDWRLWFSEDDLMPISGTHPRFIKHWILDRP